MSPKGPLKLSQLIINVPLTWGRGTLGQFANTHKMVIS